MSDMICGNCHQFGIRWVGWRLNNFTHTECPHCGARNSQITDLDEHEAEDCEPSEARVQRAMTDAPKDGGAAFPRASNHVPQSDFPMGFYDNGDMGMTLRDWFAGQALAGILAGDTADTDKAYARTVYRMADAMLEARKR